MVNPNDIRHCPECGREVKRSDMEWVRDHYGIPYKLVCRRCAPAVERHISKWRFDPADAGESLEPEEPVE